MRALILCLILGILASGYMVAAKATATVNNIKVSQQYQLSLLK